MKDYLDRLREAERQLDLYRKAVNKIDDRIEYSTFTKKTITDILADLTAKLVNKDFKNYVQTLPRNQDLLGADMQHILANNLEAFLDLSTGAVPVDTLSVDELKALEEMEPGSYSREEVRKAVALAYKGDVVQANKCHDCGCKLARNFGGLEEHKSDCPRFPL